MSDSPSYPKRIDVRSLVSGRNREPYVTIEWGKQKAQLTPAEARRHAQIITEAADAAISDAFLISWLSERVGVHDVTTVSALASVTVEKIPMRTWRLQNAGSWS